MKPITIGIDLAKSVFQVHGVDVEGEVTVRKKLRRAEVLKFFEALEPCLVGMEACATAHYWARKLSALGHDVRLMPPSYVKAYVRRQKNDAADASDPRMAADMGPPPPAVMDADEIPVDDPALDKRCREIVSPEPLDPKIGAELLKQGFKRDEIPEINVALSNIVVTRGEKWGYIWRADVRDNHAPTNEGMSRSVCWRKTPDEQPAVTSYPMPDVTR